MVHSSIRVFVFDFLFDLRTGWRDLEERDRGGDHDGRLLAGLLCHGRHSRCDEEHLGPTERRAVGE